MAGKNLIKSILIILGISGFLSVQGQDAVFSQFYNSTLYLNPALAGIENDLTVSANYREQWKALGSPYQTSQFSLIVPYYLDKHAKPFGHIGGLGLSVYNDVAGQDGNFKTTGLNSNFAYNLPFDKSFVNVLSFGLQAGFIQKRVDISTLQWGEQYSPYWGFNSDVTPTEALDSENTSFLDIGSGIFWWHNPIPKVGQKLVSINAGLSVAHMNNPNESMLPYDVQKLPLLYKFHGGIVYKLANHLNASLNTLTAVQNETIQYNVGTYLTYRFFAHDSELLAESFIRLGGWYRMQDAAILLTEFETTKFKIGFSYDWNTSSLRYQNIGISTYELFFGMKFSSHSEPKSRY